MPTDQGPKPTFKEQVESTKAYLKEMTERCDKAYHDYDARSTTIREAEAKLDKIFQWTQEYGNALCPGGHTDTFGEGMRVAKEQVSKLL